MLEAVRAKRIQSISDGQLTPCVADDADQAKSPPKSNIKYPADQPSETETLHHLDNGSATREIRDAIGKTTLHFIMRTYRLMGELPPGMKADILRKSLLIIGKECRRILGKPMEPEAVHLKAARQKIPAEYTCKNSKVEQSSKHPPCLFCGKINCNGHASTSQAMLDAALFNEAHDMLTAYYGGDALSMASMKTTKNPKWRPPDYVSHYLVYALNFFLKRAGIEDNHKLIAKFAEEQKIERHADGLKDPKHIREKYLAKHDAIFISRLSGFYDMRRELIESSRQAQNAEKAPQYEIVDDLDSSDTHHLSFYFPAWDEIFS